MTRPTHETGVSTKVFPILLDALKEKSIDPAALMEGLDLDQDVLRNPRGRVSWTDFATFLERFESQMGGPSVFDSFTARFMGRPEYGIFQHTFALAISPLRALELQSEWFGPHLFPMIRSEIVPVDAAHVRMILRIPQPYLDSPPFFRICQRGTEAVIASTGGQPGKVVLHLTPREAVYDITLPPSMTLWARLRRRRTRRKVDQHVLASLTQQQQEVHDMLQALRESEERYRHLVEQSSALIWRLDPIENRLTYASPAVKDLMGYAPEEIEELSLDDLVVEEDRPVMHQRITELMSGQAPGDRLVQELRQIRKGGDIIWCEVHATGIRNARGKLVAIQGVTHDITARKQVEEERERARAAETERDALALEIQERRRIEGELKTARDRAEEANRLKNSILASMSHEIRTPLTGLLGFADLLLRDLSDTPHEPKLQVIRRSGRRLLSLLNNMLDLARLEADNLPVETSTYPLALTIRHVVELLSIEAEQKGLEISTSVDPRLMVESDPRRDEQILLNVIGNAVRYTEQGSIDIEVHEFASEGDRPAHVEVRVTDSGVGIAPDFMPQIFEEFRQESEGVTRRFGGTGLGLAITRRLLQGIGGSIAIDSRKGVGTTVTLRFPQPSSPPVHGESMDGEATEDDLPAPPEPSGRRRPAVLVVEDDPDCLSLVESLLTPSFEVVSADSSDKAVALASSRHLDCALLDINLEGSRLDGYGLLGHLRTMPDRATLPIASMSAYTVEDMAAHQGSSFDRHFRKPLPLDDVVHWVSQACGMGDSAP